MIECTTCHMPVAVVSRRLPLSDPWAERMAGKQLSRDQQYVTLPAWTDTLSVLVTLGIAVTGRQVL